MVGEPSIANLTTSVTLRVSHSSMPKMAFGRKIKKIRLPQSFREKFCLLKARKIFRPFRALFVGADSISGGYSPVCNLFAPSGLHRRTRSSKIFLILLR